MYLMNSDLYECDLCGFKEKWDAHDDRRGDLWECERCGKHFCTNCFKKACGEEDFRKMLSETDNVLCPECWNSQKSQKEFRINIRETLETQVTVDAENKEDALREVEKRWENGEYILDADNFQRVDFWEDEAGDEFGELWRAWKEGRVLIPPCKVGDTVYVSYGKGYRPCVVDRIHVLANNEVQIRVRHFITETLWLSASDFGKTVFLTNEEAEQAKSREVE